MDKKLGTSVEYTVTEDIEIALDDNIYMLESGDVIVIEDKYLSPSRIHKIKKDIEYEDNRIDNNKPVRKIPKSTIDASSEIAIRYLNEHMFEDYLEAKKSLIEFLASQDKSLDKSNMNKLVNRYAKIRR